MLRASLLVAAGLVASATAPAAVAETRSYDFKDFRRISISALYEVEFVQSPTWSITIDSRSNSFEDIIVEKKGDLLHVGRPEGSWQDGKRKHDDKRDIVRISAPSLSAIDLHAAVTFRSRALKTDRLDLDMHAAVDLDMAGIDAKTINVQSHAGVQAKLSGVCGDLNIASHTGADLDAHDLKCSKVDISAHTGANASVFATQSLTASAHRGSNIRVAGHPKSVTRTASMASEIEIAN